jgi:hypothetical protein
LSVPILVSSVHGETPEAKADPGANGI